MAQGAQGRCNPLDGRQMLGRGQVARLGQRLRRPGQQRENLQQFLGVAGRNATLDVDLAVAVARQCGQRGPDMGLQPLQRQPGRDDTGQRLEPGQSGCGRLPAPGQKHRLRRQRAEIGRVLRVIRPLQQHQRMVDPADQPPARQVRRPARPLAATESPDPALRPRLRPLARGAVAHGGKVVQPGKSVNRALRRPVGKGHVPYLGVRPFQHLPGSPLPSRGEIARQQLPPPCEQPDRARLRLAGKARGGGCLQRTPHRPAVPDPA